DDIVSQYFTEARSIIEKDHISPNIVDYSPKAAEFLIDRLLANTEGKIIEYAQEDVDSKSSMKFSNKNSYVIFDFENVASGQIQLKIKRSNFTGAITIERFNAKGENNGYDCIHIVNDEIVDIISSSEATKENSRVADLITEYIGKARPVSSLSKEANSPGA
ncbi:MAG: hypothetical protein ACK4OM_08215, partial [Alphaproteobacteria bacterium]